MISEERFKQLANEQKKVCWVLRGAINVVQADLTDTTWYGYDNVFETEEEAIEYLKNKDLVKKKKR